MTELYIDNDIVFDLITDRKPYSNYAAQVFNLMDQKKVKGYISALCFSNLYSELSGCTSHKKLITTLDELCELVGILKLDDDIIKASISSDFKNLEDAIQYITVIEYKRIDVIITRNVKNYKKSPLPVMTPETFIKTLSEQQASNSE
jgi:PIN domain-containing protein